jgi:hypothetical protein
MITETLETQHRAMEKLVAEIFEALSRSDRPAIAERLKKLQHALGTHFALEQAQFYPTLLALAQAQQQESLEKTALLFQSNMAIIAEGLTAFFRRYVGKTDLDLPEFQRDFGQALRTLNDRLLAEEQTLHPLFVKLTRLAEKAAAPAATPS